MNVRQLATPGKRVIGSCKIESAYFCHGPSNPYEPHAIHPRHLCTNPAVYVCACKRCVSDYKHKKWIVYMACKDCKDKMTLSHLIVKRYKAAWIKIKPYGKGYYHAKR